MNSRRIEIGYHSKEEMASVVCHFRPIYDNLVERLGKLGSEIERDRILETDVDCPPFKFVRRGTMEFVFPPQDELLQVIIDDERLLDPSFSYAIFKERRKRAYYTDLVEGRIRIEYEDADDRVDFSITDQLEEGSVLPSEAEKAINDVFNREQLVLKPSESSA